MIPTPVGQTSKGRLSFTVGAIPVTIHWSVLVIVAFLAGQIGMTGAIWWATGFLVAILLHELGHAVLATRFGARDVRISMMVFGGATTFLPGEMSHGRRFLISGAGSAVGIVVAGPLHWAIVTGAISVPRGDLRFLISGFVLSAFFWGLFNWVPMLPLDGGHMTFHALALRVDPAKAYAAARGISVVAVVATVYVAGVLLPGAQTIQIFIMIIAIQGILAPNPYRRMRSPQPLIEAPPDGRSESSDTSDEASSGWPEP